MKRPRAVDSSRVAGIGGFVNRARLAGLLLVVLTAGAAFSLVTDDRFALDVDAVQISGLQYAHESAVREALDLPSGAPNVFLLRTSEMRRALEALPAVAAADVRVVLPDQLLVSITERAPVLMVGHTGQVYLLDGNGVVLEARPAGTMLPALPLIADGRLTLGIPYEVGRSIDPTEAQAMLQIGALTPALVGSSADVLELSADDTDGFVVTAQPTGWRAVFGFYTPTLRPPTLVAQQVQCLRNLLAEGESTIDTIYLAPQGDRCGTYLPLQSPSPT
jgi:hypothetical protein